MRSPSIKLAVAASALALTALACGGGSSAGKSQSPGGGSKAGPATTAKAVAGGGGVAFANAAAPTPLQAQDNANKAVASAPILPNFPDRVVKNADLTLEVKKGSFDDAWTKVLQTSSRFGGYIAGSQRNTSGAGKDQMLAGKITIRVPARRFEEAMVALRGFGRVTGDTSTSDDVTEEFVDLESRLRNLRAQQTVLLRLMDRARNVGETLQVQGQLSSTQGEIERISGRLNALKSLTEMSTINVAMAEPGINAITAAPTPKSKFAKAWDTAVGGLVGIGTVLFVGTIWLLPIVILASLAYLLARRFRRSPAEAEVSL